MTPDEIELLAQRIAAILKESRDDGVDWSQIPTPPPKNARPQCSDLSAPTMFKLGVIAKKDYGGSIGGVIKTAVKKYLGLNWAGHLDEFKAIAAANDLSLEETLNRIAGGTLKI